MTRLVPRSLFGRLAMVLSVGLIIAQLLSATINLAERDRVLVRASGMQPAQRIADIVRLLDPMSPAERDRIVEILDVPPLVVALDRAPVADASGDAPAGHGARAAAFQNLLQAELGDDRPLRVVLSGNRPDWALRAGRARDDAGRGAALGEHRAAALAERSMRRAAAQRIGFLVQVRLQDGAWATFDTQVAQDAASPPWRVLLTLAILLVAVLLMSFIAVRWITRPLNLLAAAADELGRDINRPPLPEGGPLEVSRAAHAFNTMQTRLVRFVDERTRLLTAMSHDLKTPLTRMRLRAELLDDASLREKFESDLVEMESMVAQTLDFMRGLRTREPVHAVDVMAVLDSLRAENRAMARSVAIHGSVSRPWHGAAQMLKRCLANLVDNAVIYGGRADVYIGAAPEQLEIRVRDAGPGIPDGELDRVFEAFYRLDASRSRATGGTGLGLSIARNIAQAYGGEVRLRNHPDGGLEASLMLPWIIPAAA